MRKILRAYPARRKEDLGKSYMRLLVEKHLFQMMFRKDIYADIKKKDEKPWWQKMTKFHPGGGFEEEYENILIKEAHSLSLSICITLLFDIFGLSACN